MRIQRRSSSGFCTGSACQLAGVPVETSWVRWKGLDALKRRVQTWHTQGTFMALKRSQTSALTMSGSHLPPADTDARVQILQIGLVEEEW